MGSVLIKPVNTNFVLSKKLAKENFWCKVPETLDWRDIQTN